MWHAYARICSTQSAAIEVPAAVAEQQIRLHGAVCSTQPAATPVRVVRDWMLHPCWWGQCGVYKSLPTIQVITDLDIKYVFAKW